MVDDQTFFAGLYENESAQAFAQRFPLTLTMSELNGNEKYDYLPDNLPSDGSCPLTIHTGGLMLYGSDCLVLFYTEPGAIAGHPALERAYQMGKLVS